MPNRSIFTYRKMVRARAERVRLEHRSQLEPHRNAPMMKAARFENINNDVQQSAASGWWLTGGRCDYYDLKNG